MKRTDKYKDSYEADKKLHNPHYNDYEYSERDKYYTRCDEERERQLKEDLYNQKKKNKRKKWYFIVGIILIVIIFFVVRSCSNNNDVANNDDLSDGYKNQVQNQESDIDEQAQQAKSKIKDEQASDQEIQSLKDQVSQLEQQQQTEADQELTQRYQKEIDKLEQANDALKYNVNQSKVDKMVDKVNTDIDSIITKFKEKFYGEDKTENEQQAQE